MVARCLASAKPLSEPSWNIVNWTLGNKPQWSLNRNLYIFLFKRLRLKMSSEKGRPFSLGFNDVKKTDTIYTSYLLFVNIFKHIVNDAMRNNLCGMTFQICWLVGRDKRMLLQISNKLRSHQSLHHICPVSNDRNRTVTGYNFYVSIFNTVVTLASF